MKYRIEKLPDINILCKRKVVNKPEEATHKDIVEFWEECRKDKTTQKLIKKYVKSG